MTYEESSDRVKLQDDTESKIKNAIFIIEEATLSDRNEYACLARTNYSETDPEKDSKSITYVRVKGE